MSLRSNSPSWSPLLVVLVILVFTATAAAQSATPTVSNQVTLSLDQDLISFAKWAVSLGGIFLVVFAGIGVLFFGWDVAQTRKALFEARDDIAKRLDSIRSDHASLRELKEKLEQLGAQLEGQLVKVPQEQKDDTTTVPIEVPATQGAPVVNAEEQEALDLLSKGEIYKQRLIHADLIEDAIAGSDFAWTTLSTLSAKTGLSSDEIMLALQWTTGVETKRSSTGAQLFRLTPSPGKSVDLATLTPSQVINLLSRYKPDEIKFARTGEKLRREDFNSSA